MSETACAMFVISLNRKSINGTHKLLIYLQMEFLFPNSKDFLQVFLVAFVGIEDLAWHFYFVWIEHNPHLLFMSWNKAASNTVLVWTFHISSIYRHSNLHTDKCTYLAIATTTTTKRTSEWLYLYFQIKFMRIKNTYVHFVEKFLPL